MGEKKGREFTRQCCVIATKELLDKCVSINNGDTDLPFKINNLVLFGSLVSTEKEKVHDADVVVDYVLCGDRENFNATHEPPDYLDFFNRLYYADICLFKYLKGNKKCLSLHEINDMEIALSGKHKYLIKDGGKVDCNSSLLR